MNKADLDKHLRKVLRQSQQAYRRAVAAQIRGEDPLPAWAEFHEATAALLMASWLFGARDTVDTANIPDGAIEGMLDDGDAVKFDRDVPISLEGFGTKWMAPITGWFRKRVPITRADWDLLVKAAAASAGDVTDHERENALPDLRKQSPILDSLLRGVTRGPQGAISRVKRIVDTTFFVTAMPVAQARMVQELIAQVIEERPTKSVVGKLIKTMNLGDFVTTVQMMTGTGLTASRLETVLRTNTNRAMTEGSAEVLRDERVQAFVPLVQFSATKDPRTRDTHRAFDGYVGTMADFDRLGIAPPLGFNCFPGWQAVEGAVDIGFRSLYRGALVNLNTRSGHTVTATANHPILTSRGWLPAYAVKVGDKMLRRSGNAVDAAERSGNDKGDNLPPTALQVFDALAAKAVAATTVNAKTSRHVFYGDALSMQGEIEVVWADRVLVFDTVNAERTDGIKERQLVRASSPRAGLGTLGKAFDALRPASDSSPSGSALALDSGRILLDPAPFQRFGLPLRAEMNAATLEPHVDCIARNADRFGDLVGTFASAVTLDDVVDVDVVSEWCGHVYDFRSSSGILLADSIVVSNCRCAIIPVPAAEALRQRWTRPNGTIDPAAIAKHNGARQRLVDTRQVPDPGFVNA